MRNELSDADRSAIHEALFAGQKIAAIKLYREAIDSSLKDAKDAVEAMETVLRAESPGRFKPSAAKRGWVFHDGEGWGSVTDNVIVEISRRLQLGKVECGNAAGREQGFCRRWDEDPERWSGLTSSR